MKRMLAAGYDRIYQMGPCFRKNERGPFHHPEYTMLEWYRADADYRNILDDTRALLAYLAQALCGSGRLRYQGEDINLGSEWAVRTVAEAFREYAGWDPVSAFDPDRFDIDLTSKVEPRLPGHVPCVLIDYPAALAALARLKPGHAAVAERWELYIGGLEIANAYSELTDATEQQRRFQQWAQQRKAGGRAVYTQDEAFLDALKSGMPPAGGIALGIDRLVMLFCDAASLDEVLPFRKDAL
jgi:lysyl-tRNA synthetase class 2